MGYYVQTEFPVNKAAQLVNKHGAKLSPKVNKLSELDSNTGLIVIKDNDAFEAAAYMYNQAELDAFNYTGDGRETTYVTMDKSLAEKLSGYKT